MGGMIVTIDGPAGAGKSTVAHQLARRLGFRFLNTGAMYRAVALAALRAELPLDDEDALVGLAKTLSIDVDDGHVRLDGEDVSAAIRDPEVTAAVRYAANNPGVRAILVELQRQIAADVNVVTEGRDQGTIVFPQATCKFYLTASPEERARRRLADLAAAGKATSLEDVLQQQNDRDHNDANREHGPLAQATDAVEVPTDGLELEEVVSRLEALVRAAGPINIPLAPASEAPPGKRVAEGRVRGPLSR